MGELERLPAQVDLQAMSVEHLRDWLEDVVPRLARLERWTAEARLLVGVALWRYRSELNDTAYAIEKDRLAKLADRSTRTVDGWRTEAEQTLKLVAPTVRSVGQRRAAAATAKRGAARTSDQQEHELSTPKSVDNSPVDVTASEHVDPDAEPLARRAIIETVRVYRDLAGKVPTAKLLRNIAEGLDPGGNVRTRPSSNNGQTAGPCTHPVNRRIGSDCGACGASVKAAR